MWLFWSKLHIKGKGKKRKNSIKIYVKLISAFKSRGMMKEDWGSVGVGKHHVPRGQVWRLLLLLLLLLKANLLYYVCVVVAVHYVWFSWFWSHLKMSKNVFWVVARLPLTVDLNENIHFRNELRKIGTNPCLWVLGQCKIIIFKIPQCCPFFTLWKSAIF